MWRASVGYVPQSVFLADETAARNIAFGVPPSAIQPERLEKAARAARIHDFLAGLPQAYETPVGENGVRLSGGQRQRLGIARALYHDPDVLIFDEATSSLDQATEEEVMAAISELSQKTVVLVAHRLRTVQHCDRILVLEQGSLIASGTYQQLLAECGAFQRLAQERPA